MKGCQICFQSSFHLWCISLWYMKNLRNRLKSKHFIHFHIYVQVSYCNPLFKTNFSKKRKGLIKNTLFVFFWLFNGKSCLLFKNFNFNIYLFHLFILSFIFNNKLNKQTICKLWNYLNQNQKKMSFKISIRHHKKEN